MRAAVLASALLWPALTLADGRGVLVINHSAETIRSIQISPAGSSSAGENRLRSQLPAGAQARIGYSTGCNVDVRLGFASGRTEEFLGRDACGAAAVEAGQGTAGAAVTPLQHTAAFGGRPHKGKEPVTPTLASKVVVPPWNGHSITRKFGGLD